MRKVLSKSIRFILAIVAMVCAVTVYGQGYDAQIYRQAAVGENNVYVATSQGLVVYDKITGEFETFATDKFYNMSAVTMAPDGCVTIGCYGSGGSIANFNGEDFVPVELDGKSTVNVSDLLYVDDILYVGMVYAIIMIDDGSVLKFEPSSPLAAYAANYDFNSLAYNEFDNRVYFGVSSSNVPENKLGYVDSDGLHYVDCITKEINDICVGEDGKLIITSETWIVEYYNGQTLDWGLAPDGFRGGNSSRIKYNLGKYWLSKELNVWSIDTSETKMYSFESEFPQDTIIDIEPEGDVLWVVFKYSGLYKLVDGEFIPATAGVSSISNDAETTSGTMSDLMGREISSPTQGQIYIRDGKKFIGR